MSLPVEFENELQAWLDACLDERFKRQQEALLTLVLKLLESILNETLRHNGEAHEKELEQLGLKIQASLDRIEGVMEQQTERIDRVARGEPIDRMN
jgi:NADH dehydrogenase FAD-containing subunit